MLMGLNHITLSTQNLDESFLFYTELLGFTPRAKWESGAYLLLNNLWLCLSVENTGHKLKKHKSYTHYAFSCSEHDFVMICQRLEQASVVQWKENSSEGNSFYFLDPDKHQLEIHVGDCQSRLDSLKNKPYNGLILF